MKKNLHLYNHWHYGDIFTSRCLIKSLIDKFNIVYYHNLNFPLLDDIDGLIEIKGIPENYDMHSSDFNNKKINTWIGQKNMEYFKKYEIGCTLKNYLSFIYEVQDFFDVPRQNFEFYLPEVNFNKIKLYEELKVKTSELSKKYKLLILICNGDVNSGQSLNFDFSPIVDNLSELHKDVLFLLTEKKDLVKDNIIFTSDMTSLSPDLLQISYISTKCNIIIGRASGPYSYSLVKENILDINKKFISFNNSPIEANYYNNLGFNLEWSNNYDYNNIFNIIHNSINLQKSKLL